MGERGRSSAGPFRRAARSAPTCGSALQHLGAALLSQWNNMPPHLQHELFEQSVTAAACDDTVEARKGIAQFLHEDKDDAEGGAQ